MRDPNSAAQTSPTFPVQPKEHPITVALKPERYPQSQLISTTSHKGDLFRSGYGLLMGETSEDSEKIVRKILEKSTPNKTVVTLPTPPFQPGICMQSASAECMQ